MTFNKLSKSFNGGSFSSSEILGAVQGNKMGYTLKSITAIKPSNITSVNGTAPYLSLTMHKVAPFTATLVLEHPSKGDAMITNASFEIMPTPGNKLTFSKLTQTFSNGGSFSNATILAAIQGDKTGYLLKSISGLDPVGITTITGTAPNLSLRFQKTGAFTATLVLEHPSKGDAVITNASFEITQAPSVNLTFNNISKPFSSGGGFTTAEILQGVQGNKTGYTIKSITNITPTDIVNLSGSKPNFRLHFLKAGICSATLVLEHPGNQEITLTGVQFTMHTNDLLRFVGPGTISLKTGINKNSVQNILIPSVLHGITITNIQVQCFFQTAPI